MPLVAWHRPASAVRHSTDDLIWDAIDLLDREAVERAIRRRQPARIFHLAGAAQVHSSWRTVVPHLQGNVLGTHHLLDAVRRSGHPCRILVVTSAQVYQARADKPIGEDEPFGPSNPYGVSKLAQDELARRAAAEDGLDVVIARPFNHAGPRQTDAFAMPSFARQIATAEAAGVAADVRVGNLDVRRDIVDVRDVVAAYERVMDAAPTGRVYNVASGRAERIGDLVEAMIALARTPVRLVSDPNRYRPSDVPVITGDASRLRTELGWSPSVPIAQTVADTLEWWREEISHRC
jgi:GDP-4-dehydro-6-deoxy-D-mannose reductase